MSAIPSLLHMDALIAPYRSLPKRGFVLLLCGLAAYNLLVAAFLVAIGAFPVPVFLGLDFLAVILAFRVSYGRARQAERVQVSSDQVRVFHEYRGRARSVWCSPTAFTRVTVETQGRYGPRVRLHLSNRALSLADNLGPKQRRDFAAELEKAIRSAKSERYIPLPDCAEFPNRPDSFR